jgi:hypothetical protein
MAVKPPDAFLSYTRVDNRRERGRISQFRQELADEVRVVTGIPFEIFQDVEGGIRLGEHWPDKLDKILDQARFFIPMVTPSYFNSSACRDELRKFLKAEEKLGRKDLILPIYYIQCPALEEAEVREANDLAKAIGERQRWDWRELRHHSFRHRKVRLAIEALAREIDTVRRRVTAKTTEEADTSGGAISLDEFKARLPLAEIAARHVRLTRRGREYLGLCPFHQEQTPSFTVSEAKGFYHCFGCGQHGNAIDFVMAIEGLDFDRAVTRLSTLTGLPPPNRGQAAARPAVVQSFEEAVDLFRLRGEPMLHGWLYQTAHLVHFEPGRIVLKLGPGTPAGLTGRIAAALSRWTGRPWLVAVADDSEPAKPTLAEQAGDHKR